MSNPFRRTEPKPLKDLSALIKDEDIIRCGCGSSAFFDWGIELMTTVEKFASPRMEDYTDTRHVKVCVGCKRPVILYAGDLYDASEYVDKGSINKLISWSQERRSKVPVKTMDP